MNQIMTIAAKEFRDRLRSGWVLACALVWLAVVTLTSVFALAQLGRLGVQGYERTAISLLNLVQYLVPLLGLLVGHDLIVREREDRTLNMILASGTRRLRVLLGKFAGAALTLALPLIVGFGIAGTVIGLAAHDRSFAPFLKLAVSGLVLGVAFCGIGLLLSTLAQSRVQALVCALLAWGAAVFVFDLGVLGTIVSTKAMHVAEEMEVICDATHVNNQADIHSAFDTSQQGDQPSAGRSSVAADSHLWIWLNPVDVFRVLNLPSATGVPLPIGGAIACAVAWIVLTLAAAALRFARLDL